ncbi:hypothetical protein BH11CYA1_BH11CYA1_05580 [soil metagenome]
MNNRFIRRSSASAALVVTALSLSLSMPASAQSDSQGSSNSASNSSSSASSSAQSSSSSDSSSSAGSTANSSTAPASDTAPSGSVLWTAPDYQVKPVGRKPSASTLPPDIAPNQGSAAAAAASGGDPSAAEASASASTDGTTGHRKRRRKADGTVSTGVYDESAAKAFSQAVSSEPQYVWLSPDRPSPASQSKFQQNRVLASTEQLSRLDSYIKELSQSIQGNLYVPGSAQLVETTNRKYSYLISFVVKNNGQITNVTSEKQVGTLTSTPLADDDENGQVVKAITKALAKVSPVKVPPAGFAPWYMLLKYEVSSGKVLVACLNAK